MKDRSSAWMDISVPLEPGLVCWPGDPEFEMEWQLRLERGDECNVSALRLGSHTGTHLDAPLHFLPRGKTLDRMPLENGIGPARVIAIQNPHRIEPEELRKQNIRRGERLLFKTRNSRKPWSKQPFREDFVSLSKEGARYLAEVKVRLVGIDYLSVGAMGPEGAETHRVLMHAGIWIMEGLDLSKVQAGRYDLLCLPLKVIGSEGAPARVVVRAVASRK